MLQITCGEIHDMHTHSIHKNEFLDELLSSVQNLIKFESELQDSPVVNNKQFTNDIIQKFIYFKDNDCYNTIIRPIILDSVINAEASSSKSGAACLNIILFLLQRILVQPTAIQKEFCDKIEQSIKVIPDYSKRFNHKDLKSIINKSFQLDIQRQIVRHITDNINVRSPIFLNLSNTRDTSIQLSDGFNFKIQVASEAIAPDKFWKYNNVNCLIVDGFIESIGEIHHLLDRAAEDNQPYILFARRLSDDVKSTIYLNRARETINLLPIEVGFDESTINILNDISMCCNADIISTHKGDVISKSIQTQIVKIKSVVVTSLGINIINSANLSNLNSHLKYLIERRDNSLNNDSYDLFDKRIKSLSSGKITLNIGTDLILKDKLSVEKFDKFFRELRSLIQTDIVYVRDIKTMSKDIKSCFIKNYPYSLSAINSAVLNAVSTFKSLSSVGHALVEDK